MNAPRISSDKNSAATSTQTSWWRLVRRVAHIARLGGAIRVQFQTTDGEWRYLGQRRAR